MTPISWIIVDHLRHPCHPRLSFEFLGSGSGGIGMHALCSARPCAIACKRHVYRLGVAWRLADNDYAGFGYPVLFTVVFQIKADAKARRQSDPFLYDRAPDSGTFAHTNARQQNRPVNLHTAVDSDTRREHGLRYT